VITFNRSPGSILTTDWRGYKVQSAYPDRYPWPYPNEPVVTTITAVMRPSECPLDLLKLLFYANVALTNPVIRTTPSYLAQALVRK
jgi:hypothetical protein